LFAGICRYGDGPAVGGIAVGGAGHGRIGIGFGAGAGIGIGGAAAQGAEGVEGRDEGAGAGLGGLLEVELALAQFEVPAGEFEAADGEVVFKVGALEGLEQEEEVEGGLEPRGIDVERQQVAGGELGEEFGLGGGLGLAFVQKAAVAVAGEGAEGDGDLVGILELGGDGFEGEVVVEPLVEVGEDGGWEVVEAGVGAGLAVGTGGRTCGGRCCARRDGARRDGGGGTNCRGFRCGGGEVEVGHDMRRWRTGMGGRGSAVRGPSVGWQCGGKAGLGGRLWWTPWTGLGDLRSARWGDAQGVTRKA